MGFTDLYQSVCIAASVQGLFHPSWLLCVYQRMFHSENKSLMREGVCHLLDLQVLQQPQFALAFSQVPSATQLQCVLGIVLLFILRELNFPVLMLCFSVYHWSFYGCPV